MARIRTRTTRRPTTSPRPVHRTRARPPRSSRRSRSRRRGRRGGPAPSTARRRTRTRRGAPPRHRATGGPTGRGTRWPGRLPRAMARGARTRSSPGPAEQNQRDHEVERRLLVSERTVDRRPQVVLDDPHRDGFVEPVAAERRHQPQPDARDDRDRPEVASVGTRIEARRRRIASVADIDRSIVVFEDETPRGVGWDHAPETRTLDPSPAPAPARRHPRLISPSPSLPRTPGSIAPSRLRGTTRYPANPRRSGTPAPRTRPTRRATARRTRYSRAGPRPAAPRSAVAERT